MDLLYSEHCFRRYFKFFEKYKWAVPADIMEEKTIDLKIAGLVNTLTLNSNRTQIQCCMYELADILDKAQPQQLDDVIDEDIYEVLLTNMNRHASDIDIQRDGIFCMYQLLKDSSENIIQEKLVTLGIHCSIVERMATFPDDIIIQATGCRIIHIIASSSETAKQQVIAMNATDIIVNAIDHFDDEDDLQLWGLEALTMLLHSNIDLQQVFLKQKYINLVLERIDSLKEYSEQVEQAFKLFEVLTECTHFFGYLSDDMINMLLHVLQYHEDCSDVQYSGLSFLLQLAKNTDARETLINNDVDDVILQAHARHPKRDLIQRKGIELFQLLCQPLLWFYTNNEREDKAQDWLNVIMVAMGTHCDNPAILIAACDSLSIMAEHHPDYMVLIDDKDGHTPLHNAIMAALALHFDDADLCQAACRAIASCAIHSQIIQEALFTKGVYIHIIKAMETHSNVASVQQYGCQALRILSLPSAKNMEEIVASREAWDLITNCLISFQDDPAVLQEAIAIIACFATDLEVIRNQCAAENLHIPVLQALQRYRDNVTLIEMAFEIIGVLTACEAMPDLLVNNGVIMTVLDAMDQHTEHLTIQQKGCILLQVFSSYLKDDCCNRTVAAIIRAMQKFHDNECLQEEACVALKLIAQVSPSYSEILVNQCAHERFFVILNEFRTKRKLIQLASGVLWFLGCSRKLQSRMLSSACAGGLIRGAHCLIQLEADVNVGEGTNTPLCAACKNNKEDMVRFLLTQGITDIQTPLNLCLEMENHNLVGLLLQKMGHDREAGIISWNGLNLGSLHPEWLAPSLSGKAFGFSIESERYTNYIQCAEKAFKKRFKILQKFTNLASTDVQDRERFHRTALESLSDDDDDDDDDVVFPTSDEGSTDEQGLLMDKVPLRVRSLTGASLPYSSYDPRIVLPLTVGDPILLPRRSHPGTTTITSTPNPEPRQRRTKSCLDSPDNDVKWLSESCNSDESRESALVKQRSKSTVVPPTFEFAGPAFIINTTPCRRRKASETSLEEDSSPLPRTNSFRRGRRKTAYFPRGQTDATVSILDISRNRISDLSLFAQAGENILGYCYNIVKLDLSNNLLSDIPSELCDAMPHLRHVSLSNNNFEQFPFCLTDAPRLRHLDLSSNHLQLQDDPPDDVTRTVLVEHLSLANNQLKSCPKWLSDFFPGLTFLSVADNHLSEFPETNHKMQFLKTLDVSKNKITSIPDSFQERFSALECLNASHNELSVLPDSQTDAKSNLTTLRLAHNKLTEAKPFFIPRFILRLSKLKVLDLSHNQLTCLPPIETWKTTQLKELDVSYNSIQRINLDTVHPCRWTSLERFNLRNNNLKDVPRGIGHITSLTSLDLSHNPGITSLPDEMGRLSNLWDLQLTGLKLDIEESLLTNTKKLVDFFNSKLMNSVPYYRMKLVAVGLERRGKTTLLNQLQKSKCSQSANELVIRDWTLRDSKATCKQCHHKSVIYTISTWDLKGREDMYQAFQCFMTSRTLYLAVYDVTNGGDEFEALRPWLQTIHACAPNVPVMLVGTHWDKVPTEKMAEVKNEMKDRARMLFSSPGLPDIKAHVVLNCTQETAGIQALRTSIVDLVVKCKCKGHSILGSRVPQKFVKLQELIEKVKITDSKQGRWLTEREIKKLLQDNDVLMSEGELGQAVKFLHEAGVLLHYDDPVSHLNDLYFTDPVWLNQLISTVVIPRKATGLATNGILTKSDLIGLFDGDVSAIVQSFFPQFLRLLERYGILLPIRQTEYLVPSRVQSTAPSAVTLPDLTSNTLYRRFYDMAFVPLGFWSRLITRLLLFLPKMDKDSEDTYLPSSVVYWQSGIQVNWSAQSFFTLFQDTSGQFGSNVLAITVPINDYGSHLLSNLVDHVDVLIEEWFPSLCDLDPVQGAPLVSRLCPCIACEGDTCHVYTLEECIEQALRYEDVVCPRTSQRLPVERVAPDVELADLKLQNLLIKEHDLVLDQKKENVLGDGSYGTVYKAKYNDRVVAVKVFHTDGHIDPHRLLRQEVPFLANLCHPSILTLYGVSVRPRALVLEIAPLGSLSALLNKGEVLSRGLQHRIALQVAEGLAYLHRNEIVYRDMKPHNILMFSMSLSIVINAKISDFGIARYTTMYGLKSSEGTPGYRAPEVVRGDVAYNKKSDLYSYGMLLYELVTGGRRPFEDVRFRNELDAAVMQGKMIDPITDSGSSPWPDVEDLIEHLLEPRANMRPTADQVVDRLCTAELLCLKRAIAVCKEKTVECVAVRYDGDTVELWMGSGVSNYHGGQVSWINLTDAKTEGCQGTGLNDRRVTAITAVHNDCVVVGTQSGTLCVFDASRHQCLPYFQRLPDSIICLRHYYNSKTLEDIVIAGLADGSLIVYKTRDIKNQSPAKSTISLCGTHHDDDCHVHPVACLVIAKRHLYCGCGNAIVVCKLDNNSVQVQRRWSIQDTQNQCVLNIAVDSHIWTSTKDSPCIDVWDSSTPVLRHTVDCRSVVNIEGDPRDLRVVSMLLDHKTLWVGLATGHVISLSTKSREPLFTFKRHYGPVRCLAVARRNSAHGKPMSLLITGGMGYIQRPGYHSNERHFGYVLVLESDLSAQSERLKDNATRRSQMMSSDSSK